MLIILPIASRCGIEIDRIHCAVDLEEDRRIVNGIDVGDGVQGKVQQMMKYIEIECIMVEVLQLLSWINKDGHNISCALFIGILSNDC
jgi:hypothetical protein